MRDGTSSFLIVANRLPVDRVGENEWRRSPGGLVTAIAPVMQRRDGAWLGWTGAAGRSSSRSTTTACS